MHRVKFYKFVGNSYPHISANFCTFTSIFHQMVLIIPWVPIVFTVSSFEYWIQTFREQGLGEKATISSYTLNKGESWALLRKCAVELTTLAQPFCVNQRPATASACTVCHCKTTFTLVGPTKLWNNVSKMLIVKSQTVIDCLQLSDTETRDGKMTSFLKSCMFIFWVNGLLKL